MAVTRLLLHGHGHGGKGGGGAAVVPVGAIAIWSGALGTIPANWSLCDGSGGTPNLIARFIRGAPAATDPGTTGGSDTHSHTMTAAGAHTHTMGSHSHSHTTNSAGAHNHRLGFLNGHGSGPVRFHDSVDCGAHQHTVNSAGDHTHTMDDPGNHTHTISTEDGRPPYYEVAFIQAGAGAAVAVGLIILWTGTIASIPAGWALCDGGDSRPDLRSRFIRGVETNATNPGTIGGSDTHTHTEGAAGGHTHTEADAGTHSHTFNSYSWTHGLCHNELVPSDSDTLWYSVDDSSGAHTHADTDNIGSHNHNPLGNAPDHTHTINAASSRPAYYDVAFIINESATTIPSGGILIWTDILANIPAGYNLCDGGDGRPDLRGRFVRGADAGNDPGGTGGSDTHSHTENDHSHTHTETSAGAHQHSATDSIGAHSHGSSSNLGQQGTGAQAYSRGGTQGNHSHTFNSEDDHTHTLNSVSHNHNPLSTEDTRPAYYEVAFIMKA